MLRMLDLSECIQSAIKNKKERKDEQEKTVR